MKGALDTVTFAEEDGRTTVQRALEAVPVVGGDERRLVEGDGSVVALRDEAVEDDDDGGWSDVER